jgi:hypothetical protein
MAPADSTGFQRLVISLHGSSPKLDCVAHIPNGMFRHRSRAFVPASSWALVPASSNCRICVKKTFPGVERQGGFVVVYTENRRR